MSKIEGGEGMGRGIKILQVPKPINVEGRRDQNSPKSWSLYRRRIEISLTKVEVDRAHIFLN